MGAYVREAPIPQAKWKERNEQSKKPVAKILPAIQNPSEIENDSDSSYTVTPVILSQPTESSRIQSLRDIASTYIGVPYRYGGENRFGTDCSGLVRQLYRQAFGIELPRSSAQIATVGHPISRRELEPGDLIFFRRVMSINHSGIYLGDGMFIHASSSRGVIYSNLEDQSQFLRFAGARRVLVSENPSKLF